MQYKTLVLQYLRQRPEIHNRLKTSRTLLPTLDSLAKELKANHQAWMEQMAKAKPGSNPDQIKSEALEIALQTLKSSLPPESTPNEDEPLSLDGAMAYIRSHMPTE